MMLVHVNISVQSSVNHAALPRYDVGTCEYISVQSSVNHGASPIRVQRYIVSRYTAIRKVYDTYRDTQNQTIRTTIQQVLFWLASILNAEVIFKDEK